MMTSQYLFNDLPAGQLLSSRARGVDFNPVTDASICRMVGSELAGGVLYTGYTGSSMEVHAAGFTRNWLNRGLLWLAFAYPFEQLKVNKLFARIRTSNEQSLKFNENLGFKREAILRDVYEWEDVVVLGMYRAECRHLDIKLRR